MLDRAIEIATDPSDFVTALLSEGLVEVFMQEVAMLVAASPLFARFLREE